MEGPIGMVGEKIVIILKDCHKEKAFIVAKKKF